MEAETSGMEVLKVVSENRGTVPGPAGPVHSPHPSTRVQGDCQVWASRVGRKYFMLMFLSSILCLFLSEKFKSTLKVHWKD